MKKNFRTVVLTGVVLVSTVFSAGAASAASQWNDKQYDAGKAYRISLESLIQTNPQELIDRLCSDLKDKFPKGDWQKPAPEKGVPSVPEVEQPAPEAEQPAQPEQPAEPEQPTAPEPQPTTPAPQQPAPQPTTPDPQQPNPGENVEGVSQQVQDVVKLVNEERAKAGLQPLTLDAPLSAMALDKAKDMYHNNYFSHNSPTYGSPFDMMDQYNINYSSAGENIAKGQSSAEQVMNDWMNSEGHKKNILSPNFTKIGVSYYNDVWVQAFTG